MKLSFKVTRKFTGLSVNEKDGKKYITVNVMDANTGDEFGFTGNEYLEKILSDESKFPIGCECEFSCTVEKNYSTAKKTWYTFTRCFDVTRWEIVHIQDSYLSSEDDANL